MTFRLRRKHPITPLSIVRTGHNSLVRSVILALLLTSGTATVDAAEPAKSGIRSVIPDPIGWLKNRSARKRWEKQKAQELLRQAEDAQYREPDPGLRISDGELEPISVNDNANSLLFSGGLPVQLVSEESADSGLPPLPAPLGGSESDGEPIAEVEAFVPLAGDDADSDVDFIEAGYQDTASDPQQLRSIKEILPYLDYRPEMKVETGLDPTLKAPEEIELSDEAHGPRELDPILYQWQASNLYHYPLYFEDPGVERYGHVHDEVIQPFVSLGRFGLQLAGLPYQMTIDPVCKKRYTLGWYRPGECAPKQVKQIPWNTKAALNQAAVTTGMWYALP